MRVLFDLVHPADALFFHHAIGKLEAKGAQLCIASRDKDVLPELLGELGHRHIELTQARSGLIGQARELVERDIALFKLARTWKPDVMAGFGGVAISHVGKLLGIPSVSFYDTEHAALQIRLTLPFISEWHVPQRWNGAQAKGRTFRFSGSKQFAYLHPDHFRPDPELAKSAGWDAAQDNFLIRTVAWQSNHDIGHSGMSLAQLRETVALLSARGKVHISAEGELPADLETMRITGKASAFHHLLAHCRLYWGESMTVASEATALGVPAVLQNHLDCAYMTEQFEAGLARRHDPASDIANTLDAALREDQAHYRERAHRFASASQDINAYIVDAISRAGGAA